MSAGGDVYDVADYSAAAANGRATVGAAILDLGGSPTSQAAPVTVMGVGAPANRIIPNGGGAHMTKTNLRTAAFYLAVGAVVVFAVAHLAPIRGR